MKNGLRAIIICVALIVLTLLAACGKTDKSTQANLTTVKVAYDDAVTEGGIILADKLGYFANQGIKIEYVKFNSGSDELSSLISNQVDVSRGIISAALFNAVSQGFKMKIVADGGYNVPEEGYFQLALKKGLGAKVKDFSDLKGLRISIASKGSINQLFVEKALEKGGLTENDIEWVVVDSFPDMLTAVANNSADATMNIEPLITKGVEEGILEWWKDPDTYAKGEEISAIMYSPNFAQKTDLGRKFMIGYLQGVRAYCDALLYGNKNQDMVIGILTKYTSVSDANTLKNMKTPGLEPNGRIIKSGVVSDQQWYIKKGLVKQEVNVDNIIDESYSDYAVKVLGEYKLAK